MGEFIIGIFHFEVQFFHFEVQNPNPTEAQQFTWNPPCFTSIVYMYILD